MVNLFSALQKLNRPQVLLLGVVLMAVTSLVDYATGPELGFSIFYFIPIAILAWYHSLQAGVVASVVSALLWVVAGLLSELTHSPPPVLFWNTVVRILANLILTFTLVLLHDAQIKRRDLTHFIIHDLRSPLSNILTGQHLLLMSNTLDESNQELVRVSIESGQRLTLLINSILDVEKFEGGKMPVAAQAVNVHTLVESATSQVSGLAAQNGIRLQVEIAVGAGAALADAELTRRVLVNLLDNALKYSPAGSVVVVHAGRTDPDRVTITVKDHGPGIPPAQIRRIFDKFVQVDASGVAARRGSGLGLAFCRLAVEAQGGRIWVENEQEGGTAFSFTLPADAAA